MLGEITQMRVAGRLWETDWCNKEKFSDKLPGWRKGINEGGESSTIGLTRVYLSAFYGNRSSRSCSLSLMPKTPPWTFKMNKTPVKETKSSSSSLSCLVWHIGQTPWLHVEVRVARRLRQHTWWPSLPPSPLGGVHLEPLSWKVAPRFAQGTNVKRFTVRRAFVTNTTVSLLACRLGPADS